MARDAEADYVVEPKKTQEFVDFANAALGTWIRRAAWAEFVAGNQSIQIKNDIAVMETHCRRAADARAAISEVLRRMAVGEWSDDIKQILQSVLDGKDD